MRKGITIALLGLLTLTVAMATAIYAQTDSCQETITADGTFSGQLTSECVSNNANGRYAKFYTFTLAEQSRITILLESTDADTYLLLLEGDSTGTILRESKSRIRKGLSAGTYTIEVTTNSGPKTGSFTLTISGIPADPYTATPTSVPATPTPEPQNTPTPDPQATPTRKPQTLSDMVERVRPSVVKIVNPDANGQGSGAIFKTEGMNGYIITNYHVVRNTRSVKVMVGDNVPCLGTVLGVDETRDLAVVRICCAEFRPVDFGDSTTLNVGDQVVAIGYARDAYQPRADKGPERVIVPGVATVTPGIVSAFCYDSAQNRD